MLTLFYITNRPEIARLAQDAGVDRIFVDLETLGKEKRQKGRNTVISYHNVQDVSKIKEVLTSSKLLVRVDPINPNSKKQIDDVINRGADYIMLPMYQTIEEVERFVDYVGGRAKVMLLLETAPALARLEPTLEILGVDEIHIGLNDLHLSLHLDFMFEPLAYGLVEYITSKIAKKGIKYGFGGIARIGYGMLPAENIITEHYRLGSSMAILSRSFCDANMLPYEDVKDSFIVGMHNIREFEEKVCNYSEEQFYANHLETVEKVKAIVSNIQSGRRIK